MITANGYEKSRRVQVSEHVAVLIPMGHFPDKRYTVKNLMWNAHSRIVPLLYDEMAAG